ncbi:MAG: isoleucine--tRNA ligase [Armatimonadota bacterium]
MAKTSDYQQTLNLPKTAFPMKANLRELEPRIQRFWGEIELYRLVQERRQGCPKFVLHDGPPFSNGDIHLGQALNKVLKDVVVKFKTMRGFDCPYVPGWDNHGLPTEIAAIRTFEIDRHRIDSMELRQRSEETARHFVGVQSGQFQRLGVRGDWEHPYLTMDREYEVSVLECFLRFVEQKCVYRGLKPVHWCPECETALADAELEYADHTSLSVFIRFPVVSLPAGSLEAPAVGPVSFAVWTTTPWTLPADVAVAVHPKLEYVLVRTPEEYFVLARGLLEQTMAAIGVEKYEVVGETMGAALEGGKLRHPFEEREVPVVLADYVTLEQGTGCVHTAPGHGREDFDTGQRYGLPTLQPLDERGVFTSEGGEFAGLSHHDADPLIVEAMKKHGTLISSSPYQHQYPHCWRCDSPVIFRATKQWFVDLTPFTERALAEVERVKWVPHWGLPRIRGMMEGRPDWCISRQRAWGIPIPTLYCEDCGHELLSTEVVGRAIELVRAGGSAAWYTTPIDRLAPEGAVCRQCGSQRFRRERDIFDVWFESGSSHAAVLKTRPELRWPADLYLEGHDQYRGWFQLSLWNALISQGRAPYDTVLTTGFVLDATGRKMSKRLGNAIDPQDVVRDLGAEILRLWVSYVDFKEDMPTGHDIFGQVVDGYRRLRNTLRFMLANLYDFDPGADRVSREEMREVDRWILDELARLVERLTAAYEEFEFHQVYYRVHEFCAVELSQIYLDLLKDRLYTYPPRSAARRSAQTALWELATTLAKVLTPILSHTTEEVWQHLPGWQGKEETVQLAQWPELKAWRDDGLSERWRGVVLPYFEQADRAVEELRQRGVVRQPLEAELGLYCSRERWDAILGALGPDDMAAGSGVSVVRYGGVVSEAPSGAVVVGGAEPMAIAGRRLEDPKCERCWRRQESVGADALHPQLCARCVEYLSG